MAVINHTEISFLSTKEITLIFIITRTQKRKSPEELKTLDIGTRLLDNTAFVHIHVVERFSNDFSEVGGLRSRGFQLQVTTAMYIKLWEV